MRTAEARPAAPHDTVPIPVVPEVHGRKIKGPVARGLGYIALGIGGHYERRLGKQIDGLEAEARYEFEQLEDSGRAARKPVEYQDRTRKEDGKLRRHDIRGFHKGRRENIVRGQHSTYDIVEDEATFKAREDQHLEQQQEEKGHKVVFDDKHDTLLRNHLSKVDADLLKLPDDIDTPQRQKLLARKKSLEHQLRDKVEHLTPQVIRLGTKEHDAALPGSYLKKHKSGLGKARRSKKWHGKVTSIQGNRLAEFTETMQNGGLQAAKTDKRVAKIDAEKREKTTIVENLSSKLDRLHADIEASKANDAARINARHERFKQRPVTREMIQLNDATVAFEAKLRSKAGRAELGHMVLRTLLGKESVQDPKNPDETSKDQPDEPND